MTLKAGFLVFALLAGSYAHPVAEQDMSIFFDRSLDSARIVGGSNAGLVPYMVPVVTGATLNNLICGGSLVTTRHVMTAAHCILSVTSGDGLLNSLRVNLGNTRWDRGTTYKFSHSVNHPNYQHDRIKNDIGFLITTTNVVLNNNIGLVPLNFDFVGGGVPTRVTGWGRKRQGGSISTQLQQLTATVVDGNTCISQVAQRASEINMIVPTVDPNLEICTFNAVNRGTCNLDSGGPLMRTDRNVQIGIVSWGLPCARGAPDMFVRLSAYRSFIEQTTSQV